MTIDQQEQHILSLVHRLPILRRIRLALTILKAVEPTQIPISEDVESVHDDESLANTLLQRKDMYLRGEGKTISRQELMTTIYSQLAKEE